MTKVEEQGKIYGLTEKPKEDTSSAGAGSKLEVNPGIKTEHDQPQCINRKSLQKAETPENWFYSTNFKLWANSPFRGEILSNLPQKKTFFL